MINFNGLRGGRGGEGKLKKLHLFVVCCCRVTSLKLSKNFIYIA